MKYEGMGGTKEGRKEGRKEGVVVLGHSTILSHHLFRGMTLRSSAAVSTSHAVSSEVGPFRVCHIV